MGELDEYSLHGDCAVTRGLKWVGSVWVNVDTDQQRQAQYQRLVSWQPESRGPRSAHTNLHQDLWWCQIVPLSVVNLSLPHGFSPQSGFLLSLFIFSGLVKNIYLWQVFYMLKVCVFPHFVYIVYSLSHSRVCSLSTGFFVYLFIYSLVCLFIFCLKCIYSWDC